MPKVSDPKYSKKEVSQKFNLKQLLGYSPSEDQKKLFYDLVVDKIVERSTSGKDINNRKFKKYTAEYADKKGVSRDSVNMVLEGNMLSSFESSQGLQPNVVKVKMEEGVETLKSYNHNVGDTLPKRQFFGIKEGKDLQKIVKDVDGLKPQQNLKESSLLKAISTVRVTQDRVDNEIVTAFDILFGGMDDSDIL